MIRDFLKDQIKSLENGQKVRVATKLPYPKMAIITGIVKKGQTYFYIQPVNDSHPGAAITEAEILEVIEIVTD
jgi:hypothetical protein